MRERTISSRQAGPVSQKQIRQREHDIKFSLLLFEPSVSRFSKTQLLFDNAKYVLYLRTDRRLCPFCFLCRILAALAQLFHLTGATVNFVFDLASAFVPNNRILSLLCSKIAAVTVNDFFLTG